MKGDCDFPTLQKPGHADNVAILFVERTGNRVVNLGSALMPLGEGTSFLTRLVKRYQRCGVSMSCVGCFCLQQARLLRKSFRGIRLGAFTAAARFVNRRWMTAVLGAKRW
jgi:hypothetical protein